MSAKTKEYLQASIIVLILILLIFTFHLPKDTLYTLAIVIPIVVFFNEVFPHKNKAGRKREHITTILFFLIFAAFIFIFDLSKKLYLFFGILAVSFIILYELFNLIRDKED